jgi:hypothetical protein
VGHHAEAKSEHEADGDGGDEGRRVQHGYTLTMNGAADNPQAPGGKRAITVLGVETGLPGPDVL